MKKASKTLTDKQIRELQIKEKKYIRTVGNPKELIVTINPSGIKVFSLRINGKYYKLKEFNDKVYPVEYARKEAIAILNEMNQKNITLDKYKEEENKNYSFYGYYKEFIKIKEATCREETLKQIKQQHKKYTLPILKNIDIREIAPITLKKLLQIPYKNGRYYVIYDLIRDLKKIFDIAIREQIITHNPTFMLIEDFPLAKNHKSAHQSAILDRKTLKEFIKDLKADNKMDIQTKRAIYLQILCVNRPINTVSAEWEEIDLKERIWTIKADKMKMEKEHIIPLSKQVIAIFEEQILYSNGFKYVFPSGNKNGHLHRDSLSKAIRNLGEKNKYKEVATSHGFRATFRTICTLYSDKITKLGISDKVVEECLSHKEDNKVIASYERQRATLEQKRILMQWYADFIDNIEPLGY
ncbi:tyrosine-type recombinase/integrase [Campylobacter ureolyticus]|uniref:tyrosine-type recombinase/integrase n=1 Tax=Campylobacter ureolyticus TaxID=827 RepID=UPI0029087F4F|nr:tyrosine-type recombinase/integrase [Campylobacter ureolyticus]MDU5325193.1 tyrosine-type recombinase/integrase [Campylobacter ureolyticus]